MNWWRCTARWQLDTARPHIGLGRGRRAALLLPRRRERHGPGHRRARPRGGDRARSHCRSVLLLIQLIPKSLKYSAPLFLQQQCDRTLGGDRHGSAGAAEGAGRRRETRRPLPDQVDLQQRDGHVQRAGGAISDCHFAAQLNQFIPGFLSGSVAVFPKVAIGCDLTPQEHRLSSSTWMVYGPYQGPIGFAEPKVGRPRARLPLSVQCRSGLNLLKDARDRSCYWARSDEVSQHFMKGE
jgi:hypothetical protein